MRIPEVQRRLLLLKDQIVGTISELDKLHEELKRRPRIRRAPNRSQPMTPMLTAAIRAHAKMNPTMSYHDIAQRFNVNGGRVSEALRGKRT